MPCLCPPFGRRCSYENEFFSAAVQCPLHPAGATRQDAPRRGSERPLLRDFAGQAQAVHCLRPSCTTRHSVSPLAFFSHRTSFPSLWRRSNPPKRFGSTLRTGAPPFCASKQSTVPLAFGEQCSCAGTISAVNRRVTAPKSVS